jgi:hypothetical protein
LNLGGFVDAHPRAEELRRFAEGGLSREEARRVVAHFLKGCRTCSEEAAQYNIFRIRQRSLSDPGRPASFSEPSSKRAPLRTGIIETRLQ